MKRGGGRLAGSLLAVVLLLSPSAGSSQILDRLPADVLDVTPPTARATGALSEMRAVALECRATPGTDLRRRIVETAIQEWAFFGFPVLDRLNGARLLAGAPLRAGRVAFEYTTRRAPTPTAREGARVAATIAGYWAVTPEGPGIVREQARRWNDRGAGTRWNAPWSAAFISWVMCEAGLGTRDQFHRAIAHWTYVDQAIRARDSGAETAGYLAYDIGETVVEPGDLLCSGRRPRYANLAARRSQMGEGASSHCDIVVEADEAEGRILAIGGNVLRSVSLKVLAAESAPEGGLLPRSTDGAPLYAHLKLRAESIGNRGLSESGVLAAVAIDPEGGAPARAAAVLAALRVQGEWMQDPGRR